MTNNSHELLLWAEGDYGATKAVITRKTNGKPGQISPLGCVQSTGGSSCPLLPRASVHLQKHRA